MFKTIVLAYDGSAECRNALQEGIVLANRFNATCYLFAVVPPPPSLSMVAGPLPNGMLERETQRMSEVLDRGVSRLRETGLTVTGALRMWEEPNEAIADFATEVGADLVIVGHAKRSTFTRWWRSSVGHTLLDRLSCSLFVAMPHNEAK